MLQLTMILKTHRSLYMEMNELDEIILAGGQRGGEEGVEIVGYHI